ncbi:MAG: DEAD/DEAH box helicase, partial [Akkermansiaceae bacterium]
TRTVALPQGGKAVISQHDADMMEGFLLDVDPRQQGGLYKMEKNQQGYVNQLQQHYQSAIDEDKKIDPATEEKISVPPLDNELQAILRPYQFEGVQWLFRHAVSTGAALLADDMGLGKTLQTLVFLQLWKNHQSGGQSPALIVCPASLLGNWHDEIEKFVPNMNALVMHGQKRKDYFSVMNAADIIITSYALLDKDVDHYSELKPSAIVLDEASAVRNPDTLAAKAVRKVMSPMRLAISGTPVENSVRDMWSIFQFLMPGYLGSREDFKRRYELPCQAEVPDFAALERLRWRTAPHMLRRTKSLVAKDLPPKIESVVWCDMSATQREYYRSIQQKGIAKMDSLRKQVGSEGARMQMLTLLLRLRQSCCDLRLLDDQLAEETLNQVSAKLARLMELLGEAIQGGHRVLVF